MPETSGTEPSDGIDALRAALLAQGPIAICRHHGELSVWRTGEQRGVHKTPMASVELLEHWLRDSLLTSAWQVLSAHPQTELSGNALAVRLHSVLTDTPLPPERPASETNWPAAARAYEHCWTDPPPIAWPAPIAQRLHDRGADFYWGADGRVQEQWSPAHLPESMRNLAHDPSTPVPNCTHLLMHPAWRPLRELLAYAPSCERANPNQVLPPGTVIEATVTRYAGIRLARAKLEPTCIQVTVDVPAHLAQGPLGGYYHWAPSQLSASLQSEHACALDNPLGLFYAPGTALRLHPMVGRDGAVCFSDTLGRLGRRLAAEGTDPGKIAAEQAWLARQTLLYGVRSGLRFYKPYKTDLSDDYLRHKLSLREAKQIAAAQDIEVIPWR